MINIDTWRELKRKTGGAFLLFRGDILYKCYMEDAEAAQKVLSWKDVNYKPYPVLAFPTSTLDLHLPKLIRAGLRVGIHDSIEIEKAKPVQLTFNFS